MIDPNRFYEAGPCQAGWIKKPSEPSWYAVHTRSHQEAIVEAGLRCKSLETFLPRVTVYSRRRDRRLLLKVPLFPGYLFVHADLRTSAYYDVIKSRGVVRVLGRIGECTPIPEETIRSIQKVMESGRSFDPYANLQNGMQVRVVEGPLTGAIGSILRKKPGKRRLVVSVELLGRALAVDLAEEAVEVC